MFKSELAKVGKMGINIPKPIKSMKTVANMILREALFRIKTLFD